MRSIDVNLGRAMRSDTGPGTIIGLDIINSNNKLTNLLQQ